MGGGPPPVADFRRILTVPTTMLSALNQSVARYLPWMGARVARPWTVANGAHYLDRFRSRSVPLREPPAPRRPRPSVRITDLAIISSSSVRITRTATGLDDLDIKREFAAFLLGSNSIPRKPRPLQMRARTAGEFSPIPPENTSASRPPSAPA